ncbi:MAG: polysaccharide deacetylase family protein [Candidatus Kerfeldbacteria bacterium]
MPGYQSYQKYHNKPKASGFKYVKILVILAIIFVVYLILKSLFGGNNEVTLIYPEQNIPEFTEVVQNTNTNSNTNENKNSNENSNSNKNVNINTASADSFDLESCDSVYSRGSTSEKNVSLTFNVGTTKEGDIQKVLDSLTSSNVEADFFARGDVAEENSELINKINDAGFSVYNLSYNHPHFNDLPTSGIVEQLTKTESAISSLTSKTTKPFFRPPYGEADEDVVTTIVAEGYCPITWSVDALDWSSDYSPAESKERVLSKISNGSIVLMQAANSTTAQILPELITELKDLGYGIVSLDKLLK